MEKGTKDWNVWWITPMSQVVPQCSVDGYTWMCNNSLSLAVHVSIVVYKTILSESTEVCVHLSLMVVIDKLFPFWKMLDLWIIQILLQTIFVSEIAVVL
jgi:hypothetical protein